MRGRGEGMSSLGKELELGSGQLLVSLCPGSGTYPERASRSHSQGRGKWEGRGVVTESKGLAHRPTH